MINDGNDQQRICNIAFVEYLFCGIHKFMIPEWISYFATGVLYGKEFGKGLFIPVILCSILSYYPQ